MTRRTSIANVTENETDQNAGVIFHSVLSHGTIGMVISPEWGGADETTSFSPGNQLFSVLLGDTNIEKTNMSKSSSAECSAHQVYCVFIDTNDLIFSDHVVNIQL